jgi:hypothetical protein
MKYTLILAAAAGLLLLILSAGCTSPTGIQIPSAETPTPLPTATPTTEITQVVKPVAVETLPQEQFVDVRISKERPDASIHVLYNGGKGEVFLQSILVVVTRSDGQVIEQYMNDNTRKPRRGDELVVQGTRGSDRVQIYLTSAGKVYKFIDEPIILSYI